MGARNYTDIALQYSKATVSGEIPAGQYAVAACQRFLNDLERKDWVFHYDPRKASIWCSFFECLPHVKGRWASQGERFTMSPWQIFCTANIFGWVDEKGNRRFSEVYIEVARKNGKSFWVACLGIGMLVLDGEYGAEVLCGATTEAQAWEVFRPARFMCERTPELRNSFGLDVMAKKIAVKHDQSSFIPVIGNPGDGASPSCGIVDEYHEHTHSGLLDTFATGMAARKQPLLITITTAGADMGGPCYAKRQDTIDLLNGVSEDESVFGIIYCPDDKDPWDSKAAQQKANPNLGISVSEEYLDRQLSKARRSPVLQSSYKTKHLNLWVGAGNAWMNMLLFMRCTRNKISLEEQHGRKCYLGLDLATRKDLVAVAYLFPPDAKHSKPMLFARFFLPEAAVYDEEMSGSGSGGNRSSVKQGRYAAWESEGWIEKTSGNTIDFEAIRDEVISAKDRFKVIDISFDPFQCTQFANEMLEEHYPMVEYGATTKNFSEPMKQLEDDILNGNIEIENNPVLIWCFGNTVAILKHGDNIYPGKERVENKIDGVVASIMTYGRYVLVKRKGRPRLRPVEDLG